ncbi:hypothetical protein AB0E88_35480, partial [Streptomyces sp. NPDC028635]
VESLMPLRLARYGVPLSETAPAGLAAAGIEPALIPAAPKPALDAAPATGSASSAEVAARTRTAGTGPVPQQAAPPSERRPEPAAGDTGQQAGDAVPDESPWFHNPREIEYHGGYDPNYDPAEQYAQWYAEQQEAEQYEDQYQEEPPADEPSEEETGSFPIPVGPNRTRELGDGGGSPEPEPTEEDFYLVFRKSIDGSYPTPAQFRGDVEATFGRTLSKGEAERMVQRFAARHTAELQEEHIA